MKHPTDDMPMPEPTAWLTDFDSSGRRYAAAPHEFDEPGLRLRFDVIYRPEDYWEPLFTANQYRTARREAFDAGKASALAEIADKPSTPETEWTEVDLWAEIHRLRAAVQGPAGFSSWQEAATAERLRRVKAEREIADKLKDAERDALRYRWLRELDVHIWGRDGIYIEIGSTPDELDAAIDAAIDATRAQEAK